MTIGELGWNIRNLAAIVVVLSAQFVWSSSMASEEKGFPFPEHIDQHKIHQYPIKTLYGWGKELFEAPYNHLDGAGRNFKLDPTDQIRMRYSRIPRPDLPGFVSDPIRMSGPGARNCLECHNSSSANVLNTVFNFARDGDLSTYAERQNPNISGVGSLQLLAEQASKELWAVRDNALEQARRTGEVVTAELVDSNNIGYGRIKAYPDGELDTSEVVGVDPADNPFILTKQFQVIPFYTKGEVSFLRVTAATPPIGMQSPEMYPEFIDADQDGVVNEISVGDVTSILVYSATQPRPVTKLELHKYVGGKFRLSKKERKSIRRGKKTFRDVGCADCHRSGLHIKDPLFREPTKTPGFSFPTFWNKYVKEDGTPGFTSPLPYGYDPDNPLVFDLRDLPSVSCDKPKYSKKGNKGWKERNRRSCWRKYRESREGGIVIDPYTDLKRYDMGPGLADVAPSSFGGVAGHIWKTKPLWGAGSTGPWLHDGRATTLTEAIRWHGGDGQTANDNFFGLSEAEQDDIIAFLKNLVIYDYKKNAIQPSGNGFVGG